MKRDSVAPADLSVVTFSKDISFHLNDDTLHAIHVPYSHTDSDSSIHFIWSNVIHAGDAIVNGFYQFIDINHGGSIKGMISGVKKILVLVDENTKNIHGHGPLTNIEELGNYLHLLETAYERLRKIKSEGKTVKEAIEAKFLSDQEEE